MSKFQVYYAYDEGDWIKDGQLFDSVELCHKHIEKLRPEIMRILNKGECLEFSITDSNNLDDVFTSKEQRQ